ncbi:NUDIX hydrolase [Candidatus Poriferisodalis sp.]|uniref:NUDIX hydrolase n=1 Tax=Candidatus Poriferisodalis sp. TaxID=3101277 RepID=UPI003B58CC93
MPTDTHRWAVAGGILARDGAVLMVNNRRRNGSTDWSTPGGVVDPGETVLGALTREVAEETGLQVSAWDGPLYTVEADGRDGPGWLLKVEVHEAQQWSGELDVADPDGIVFDARWVQVGEVEELLSGQYAWMAEPLLAYLDGGAPRGHEFRYSVTGDHRTGLVVAPTTP